MSVYNYTMGDFLASSLVTLAIGFGLLILVALIATSSTVTTLNGRRAEAAVKNTTVEKVKPIIMNPLSKRAAPEIVKFVPAPRMEPKSLPAVIEAVAVPEVVEKVSVPEVVAEIVPEVVAEIVPEVVAEVVVAEIVPEVMPEAVSEQIVPEVVVSPKSALDATFDAYRAAMKASSLEARGMSIAQKMPSMPRSSLRFQGKAADFLESMHQSIDERLVAQFDNGL